MKDGAIASISTHPGPQRFGQGVHIIYSVYAACAATGFRRFLHPNDPAAIWSASCAPPAVRRRPRFQQLAALLNSLIHDDRWPSRRR